MDSSAYFFLALSSGRHACMQDVSISYGGAVWNGLASVATLKRTAPCADITGHWEDVALPLRMFIFVST